MSEQPVRVDVAAGTTGDLWTLAVDGQELEVYDATRELARRGGATTRDRALAWLTDPDPRRRAVAASIFGTVPTWPRRCSTRQRRRRTSWRAPRSTCPTRSYSLVCAISAPPTPSSGVHSTC